MRKLLSLSILFFLLHSIYSQNDLKANFTSEESSKTIFYSGFDSESDFLLWTLHSTNTKTWTLSNQYLDVPAFTSVNRENKSSLFINYDLSNTQDEYLTSPVISLGQNPSLNFYIAYDGVYVTFANLTISVLEEGATDSRIVFDAKAWAGEHGHERIKWINMNVSLSDYSGKNVSFIIHYNGKGGDYMFIDDFSVKSAATDEQSGVAVKAGSAVHYKNMSEGSPLTYEWTFEGGLPATSSDENPIVIYNKFGEFGVKLKVGDGIAYDVLERKSYVTVKGESPVAKVIFPEDAYLSPYAGVFIPKDVSVQFKDNSINIPDEWKWLLPGSSQPVSSDQHPLVSYAQEGTYNVSLNVKNNFGSDLTEYIDYVTVGGSGHVWNIHPDDNSKLEAIALGWYGYYGGTNWLGMHAFAEYYKKPLKPAEIKEIEAFFHFADVISKDAVITLSIVLPDKDLLPQGDTLASSSLKATDLKSSSTAYIPTVFSFEKPILIESDFFIVISGIPNAANNSGEDCIALAAIRRNTGEVCTSYHLIEGEDVNYQPNGVFTWYKNVDDPASFALAPKISYTDTEVSSLFVEKEQEEPLAASLADNILELGPSWKEGDISVYSMNGTLVYKGKSSVSLNISGWSEGMYILVYADGCRRKAQRFIISHK